jgi:hypothetical protein
VAITDALGQSGVHRYRLGTVVEHDEKVVAEPVQLVEGELARERHGLLPVSQLL